MSAREPTDEQRRASPLDRLHHELQELRAESGLSLRELSRKTEIAASTLMRFFRGPSLPRRDMFAVVVKELGGDPLRFHRLWTEARLHVDGTRREAAKQGSPSAVADALRTLAKVIDALGGPTPGIIRLGDHVFVIDENRSEAFFSVSDKTIEDVLPELNRPEIVAERIRNHPSMQHQKSARREEDSADYAK